MSAQNDSSQPVPAQSDQAAAHALFAAIAQMGLVLSESQRPVAELGAVLTRLAERVTAATAGSTCLKQLHADVFNGIQQLQFYDRLVQHLSHIQNYLIGIANELDSTRSEPRTQEAWEVLHAKLRQRLISDEQRVLFDLFLTPDTATRVSARAMRSDHSPPGSLEMF